MADVVILVRSSRRNAPPWYATLRSWSVYLGSTSLRKLTIEDSGRFDAPDLVHPMPEWSLFEIRASVYPVTSLSRHLVRPRRTANALRRAEAIRRGDLSSLHVEAHLSNRPAPLAARLFVSPWQNLTRRLYASSRRLYGPYAATLTVDVRVLLPVDTHLSHRIGIAQCPYTICRPWLGIGRYLAPTALSTGTPETGLARNRWRRPAKLIGRTKQAPNPTAYILHLRMMGWLVMTRRVGEGSRTRALDLTRQRACWPRCAGGLWLGRLAQKSTPWHHSPNAACMAATERWYKARQRGVHRFTSDALGRASHKKQVPKAPLSSSRRE
jgi:hypothetical protein